MVTGGIGNWTLDADGVAALYNTLTGGTVYHLSTHDPNTEAAVSLDEGGTATAHTGSTTHISYWIYNGGPVTYESGGSGNTCRVTLKPSGPGPQTFNWKSGAITNGFILNAQDIKNSEFTIYIRVQGNLGVHTEFSMKLRGGIHTGTNDPRASCVELRVPLKGSGSPQAAREYDHPNYDFVTLTPNFDGGVQDNTFIGIKTISINQPDGKSVKNQMWLDMSPFDANGKPANNWTLYTEWLDSSDVSTGQYQQACLWAGWLYTCRVDGWRELDFTLPSVREIDPNSPTNGPPPITCPTGQHLENGVCVPDPVTCPSGQEFSTQFNKCIPICAAGQHYDDTVGKCVDDIPKPPGVDCPTGQHYDPDLGKCIPNPPSPSEVGDDALAFFYSGGPNISEATASLSTGGFISQVRITNADLNNLFGSINGPDISKPTTRYRCLYVKNISEQTAYSVRGYLFTPAATGTGTLNPGTRIRAGIGAAGKNRIELFLNDDTKPPHGVCIASYYSGEDKYMWLGILFPHQTMPIWIERRSIAGIRTWSRDQTQLVIEYDQKLNDPTVIPNLCSGSGSNDIPCPTGQHFDFGLNICVPDNVGTTCPPGQHFDVASNQCVPDDSGGGSQCPPGQHFDTTLGQCVPDGGGGGGTCPPGQHLENGVCVPDEANPCDQVPAPSTGPDAIAQIYSSRTTAPAAMVSTLDSFDTAEG